MPLYFSAHTTACLTKQAIRELMGSLLQSKPVKVRRSVASQLAGRMVLETESPDQPTLEKWFEERRLNCQWVMRIDLAGDANGVTEF
ncbi:MAG TPA: hypothetical protein VMX16_01260 [Terriglobia bacterium]|nr:hypothetical protein [Terriglobia bacterium]